MGRTRLRPVLLWPTTILVTSHFSALSSKQSLSSRFSLLLLQFVAHFILSMMFSHMFSSNSIVVLLPRHKLKIVYLVHYTPERHQPTHRRCVVVTPYSHLPSNPSIAEVTHTIPDSLEFHIPVGFSQHLRIYTTFLYTLRPPLPLFTHISLPPLTSHFFLSLTLLFLPSPVIDQSNPVARLHLDTRQFTTPGEESLWLLGPS